MSFETNKKMKKYKHTIKQLKTKLTELRAENTNLKRSLKTAGQQIAKLSPKKESMALKTFPFEKEEKKDVSDKKDKGDRKGEV